jgi:hypothetical protein
MANYCQNFEIEDRGLKQCGGLLGQALLLV